MSYVAFVAVAIWKDMLPKIVQGPSMPFLELVSYLNANNDDASVIRVLVARTCSPSEIPIVVEDLMYVRSFYSGRHEDLRQESRSRCGELREYAATLDPHANGTRLFPNHILCNSNDASTENNYWTVRADFMIFARSNEWALNISRTIDRLSEEARMNSLYEVDVDIKDVSGNPQKIWNWILHCTDERLEGYDYMWFVDGDISLKSLNWQGFWQQVRILRPKITQASTIGDGRKGHATVHHVLRYNPDSRLLAGEVPILEVQSPLLEVGTWLRYRTHLVNDPEPMVELAVGGEQCFDMAWCHLAKNNLTGVQSNGKVTKVAYHNWQRAIPLSESDVDADMRGRGCVVLYQTPIVHISKYARAGNFKSPRFVFAQSHLCRYFRLKLGAVGKGGLKTVYELFNAPEIK